MVLILRVLLTCYGIAIVFLGGVVGGGCGGGEDGGGGEVGGRETGEEKINFNDSQFYSNFI